MSNPDETLRNLYPRFMNAMDYTIALLEEERDEALADSASKDAEIAYLRPYKERYEHVLAELRRKKADAEYDLSEIPDDE